MTTKNHGVWVRYTPDPWPEGLPEIVLFRKRNSDGVDWYAYNHDASNFTAGSIKCILSRTSTSTPWVVTVANRDATQLFPGDGNLLIEVTSDTGTTDGAEYIGHIFSGGEVVAKAVDLVAYAKSRRWVKETSDMMVSGQAIALDDRSKTLILGSFVASQRNPAWTTMWQGVSGEFAINAAAIAAIFDAMQARLNACFTTYSTVVAGISSGSITTTAAIDEAFASVP
jgi:hypothetical protein